MKRNIKEQITRLARLTLAVGLSAMLLSGARAQEEPITPVEEAIAVEAAEDTAVSTNTPATSPGRGAVQREAMVLIGKDAELPVNESAEVVVVIGGNAQIRGQVRDAAVAVFGDLEISGEVKGDVVAVLGTVKLLPGAVVRGQVVSVMGGIERAEGAEVRGAVQEIGFGTFGLPEPVGLKTWFKHCALKLRPLALQVGWVWWVAAMFFVVYLLAVVAFPKPVAACANELQQRPFTTFLLGLLAKLTVPILIGILFATGFGVIVIPFLLAAVGLGLIIGKAALLVFLGQALSRAFTGGEGFKPLLAFLLGTVVLTLIYLVPVLGLIAFGVASTWALGAVVVAMFGGFRRERNLPPGNGNGGASAGIIHPAAREATANAMGVIPPAIAPLTSLPADAAPGGSGVASSFVTSAETPPANPATSAAAPGSTPPVGVPDAVLYPRASFWERMGAAFLDVILVSILGALVGGPPLGFLVALAYFAGMWAWKGTTIGGIVLSLKVARLDGGPVTFPVALVRGLAAAFSVVVLFLGFLWIAWDRDKQGWHDKIAGTVVLRQPRGQPLVCL